MPLNMSGYLEVKLLSKPSKGLTPWKNWKKQWCILRPCPLKENGAIITFYSSAGMSVTSSILLPSGSVVCRTASRSKKYAFGIFPSNDLRKPLIFLCGQSESDSQLWIAKIRILIDGRKAAASNSSTKSFSVSLIDNDFSRKLNLEGLYGTLNIEKFGIIINDDSPTQRKINLSWDDLQTVYVLDWVDNGIDTNKICVLSTSRYFLGGSGKILLFSSTALHLVKLAKTLKFNNSLNISDGLLNRRLSKSEGNLTSQMLETNHIKFDSGVSTLSKENVKCYVGTNDDITSDHSSCDDESPLKEKVAFTPFNTAATLSSSRSQHSAVSSKDLHLSSLPELDYLGPLRNLSHGHARGFVRRCSSASISSGIYEEISEDIPVVLQKRLDHSSEQSHDNTYEVVKDFKGHSYESHIAEYDQPPPLPPRFVAHMGRHDSTSDSGLDDGSWCSTPSHDSAELKWNMIHCSTGSLPRCYTNPPIMTQAKPSQEFDHEKTKCKGSSFNVFRKRIKSDSRVVVSKDSKSSCTYSTIMQTSKCSSIPRKKRFDFNVTPSKSISLIKNSRVGRAILKNMKSSSSSVKNDVAKSCEFLNLSDGDEVDGGIIAHRSSRSVEHLEIDRLIANDSRFQTITDSKKNDILNRSDTDRGMDLSLMYSDDSVHQSITEDIFELILKDDMEGIKRKRGGLRLPQENYYMPMSPRPFVCNHAEEQYVVMTSPKVPILEQCTPAKSP